MKKIFVVPLLLLATLFAIPTITPPARAAQVGVVCIAAAGTTGCPSTPHSFSVPVGSSLTVQVNLFNSSQLNGFDIVVQVDPSILTPTAVALVPTSAGGLIRSPFIGSQCVNGIAISGVCSPQGSLPGTVELGVVDTLGLSTTFPTSGALLTATFTVKGSTVSSPIGFATGCTSTSVSNTCISITNGTPVNDPETAEPGIFGNVHTFSLAAVPNPLMFPAGFGGTSTITLTSSGFSGSVSLSAAVSPAGPTASLSPTNVPVPLNGIASSILTVDTTLKVAPGPYVVAVTATGTDTATGTVITQTLNVDVTVTVFTGVIFTGGKLHWTHHLVIPSTGGVQTWTAVVDNVGGLSQNVMVVIAGSSSAGIYSASSPVVLIAPGKASFSFTTPVDGSFIGAKIDFTAVLLFGVTTPSTPSPVTKSGAFAVG